MLVAISIEQIVYHSAKLLGYTLTTRSCLNAECFLLMYVKLMILSGNRALLLSDNAFTTNTSKLPLK